MRRCLLLLSLLVLGCEKFDAPPQPTIIGSESGVLADPTAPIALGFHEPIVAATLGLRIVQYTTDVEGNLLPDATTFFVHPAGGGADTGGTSTLDPTRQVLTIDLDTSLPIGPQLAMVIDPGLSDDAGNVWNVQQIIKFGYVFECDSAAEPKPTAFPSAVHFMLVNVDKPIKTQIQLFADIHVDAESGTFIGQFTNADRDAMIDCTPLGQNCDSAVDPMTGKPKEVCRTLPAPECVVPSTEAGNEEEYPDYAPNPTPPDGYSFTVRGCIRDSADGLAFSFANEPVDIVVQSPPVTATGVNFNASFSFDGNDVLRGSGTFTAAEVLLGTTTFGPGNGSVVVRDIPPADLPPDIPAPPNE
jgi:hypothetical protein